MRKPTQSKSSSPYRKRRNGQHDGESAPLFPRRSPRFTPHNNVPSGTPEPEPAPALPKLQLYSELRRSPRFAAIPLDLTPKVSTVSTSSLRKLQIVRSGSAVGEIVSGDNGTQGRRRSSRLANADANVRVVVDVVAREACGGSLKRKRGSTKETGRGVDQTSRLGESMALSVKEKEKDYETEWNSPSEREGVLGRCPRLNPRDLLGNNECSSLEVQLEVVEAQPLLFSACENEDGDRLVVSTEKHLMRRRSPRFSYGDGNCISGTGCPSKSSPIKNLQPKASTRNVSVRNKAEHTKSNNSKRQAGYSCCLIGDPVPADEAQERWGWRYKLKSKNSNRQRPISDDGDDNEDKIVWNVKCHYTQAEIAGGIINIGDCACIKGEGAIEHVGRIVEFFKTLDGEDYFRVQWFYRAEDTVLKAKADLHDKKRLFYSIVMNDNPVDCIISKVTVTQLSPMINSASSSIPASEFYFDMEYSLDYSTFRCLFTDGYFKGRHTSPPDFDKAISTESRGCPLETVPSCDEYKVKLMLLDLFSGCGGMSTGLCLGAKVSGIDIVTRWALDLNNSACESLKLNHPETQVRSEVAEDFLELLKEWKKLCNLFVSNNAETIDKSRSIASTVAKKNKNSLDDSDITPGEYEVEKLVDISYGDIDETGKRGIKFKVRWKGYSSSEDTWEPIQGLCNCREAMSNFVRDGYKSKILPLPGDVDVICGGPPCQGISGYNRFRNVASPLEDERNRQIIVFMDIVQFLEPKFVLMENVVDILRFDNGSLARYAISRLVNMKYQARLGTIAAGCYGLPQFRLRAFLWGAHPSEKLPQFPLPTHDVVVKYWPPIEFERNTVAYDEDQPRDLEKAVVLQDAISDLPKVTSCESPDVMAYKKAPETEFQYYMRSRRHEWTGSPMKSATRMTNLLYDHRAISLTEDDSARVSQIPKRKGANFRDLPGVVVGTDNVARRDPETEHILPSGKQLVPDFAFTFAQGKCKRPYARLWWDETVSTVLTYPDLHCQIILHPEQDRVLTIRECARLQGFPDYYRFCGTVKERYRQIGNAVPVSVSRALGYALGMAVRRLGGDEPLIALPPKFSCSTYTQLAKSWVEKTA